MPDRLADEHDSPNRRPASRGPLAHGSPARYHIPSALMVLSCALGSAALATRRGAGQRATAVAAASSLCATALSGYIIRTVNLRLLDDGSPIAEDERLRLVSRWHRLNRARLALLAVATVGFEYASWSERSAR
ncbi:DUF1772 domain-containing protein [Pseudonocardia sp. NPDC049635]|uniref:DUF1772 domain-containing protein n=1 Tax=Pseudonocardia sp. NPDC049635 TaxID=3155506 RepID=UPI0033E9852E